MTGFRSRVLALILVPMLAGGAFITYLSAACTMPECYESSCWRSGMWTCIAYNRTSAQCVYHYLGGKQKMVPNQLGLMFKSRIGGGTDCTDPCKCASSGCVEVAAPMGGGVCTMDPGQPPWSTTEWPVVQCENDSINCST